MDLLKYSGLLHCVIVLLTLLIGNVQSRQYCTYETFRAECPEQHIIQIQHATYGRMEVGKCIKQHYEMGCQKSVVMEMNRLCAGRTECEFQVLSAMYQVQPCVEGLTPYLEVTYTCLRVQSFATNACNSDEIKLTNLDTTHLSSDAENVQCQTPTLIFSTQPGQSIEIILHDYTTNEYDSHGSCQSLGHIIESVVRTNKSICSTDTKSGKVVYKSVGYRVEVSLLPEEHRSPKGLFVLTYKVTGCPDILLSDSTLYKRDASLVELGCADHETKWLLNCKENKWVGRHLNCSNIGDDDDADTHTGILPFLKELPEGVLLAIIIGVAVLFSIMILVCGFMYIASRKTTPTQAVSETYSYGPRRSDSEFKMYAGPTLRKSQEVLDSTKPILYHNTVDQNTTLSSSKEGIAETCSCASYSSIPKMIEPSDNNKQQDVYLDPVLQ